MLDTFSFAVGLASWPVLVYIALFILLTVEVAYDSGFVAFMTLAVGAAFATWMGWISTSWALHNWHDALLFAVAYVPVGVLWAVVKWWFYVKAEARSLNERILDARASAKQYDRDPDAVVAGISRNPPQVRQHKSDIMRWMGWWPFSLVATLLNDPFRRMFEAIYRWLGNFLQDMSDRAFAHLQLSEEEKTSAASQNTSRMAR